MREDGGVSTVRGSALVVVLLLAGCSGGGGEAAGPQPTGTRLPTDPAAVAPSTAPGTAEPPPPSVPAAPQPPAATAPVPGSTSSPCAQDGAARRTCTFVEAVLTGTVATLTPPEQEVALRVDDLPLAPWGLSGCELVGDVTVECQVLFSPPRQQEVVATFVLQPVDGGYAVIDYLGAL